MKRRLLRKWVHIRRFLGRKHGQATIEYALIFVWGVAIVFAAFEALEAAISNYYYDVVSLICLPIP